MNILQKLPCASLLFVASSAALVPSAASAASSTEVIRMGNNAVRLVTTKGKLGGPVYFHPHENERTSAAVARLLVERKGGTLLEIECAGTRLVSFNLEDKHYTFDPNRMFTESGLQKSLAKYGPYSLQAAAVVKSFREAVLSTLTRTGKVIVAVHNNAATGMKISDYRDTGMFAKEAASVAVPSASRLHEFFLVVDPALFAELEHRSFNVVLQSATATDDGSLSVYCQRKAIRYVNVESQEGNSSEQQRMLTALLPLLSP